MVSNSVLLRPFAFAGVKNTFLFLFLLYFFKLLFCQENRRTHLKIILLEIKTGADNFAAYLPLLKDKKIGIVTNQTGILSNKTHLVDFLAFEKTLMIQTIFAPEHGFRGTADAGEHVIDGKDAKTGFANYFTLWRQPKTKTRTISRN